eukprot:211915-Pelagomonas_calceolata.AAC.1
MPSFNAYVDLHLLPVTGKTYLAKHINIGQTLALVPVLTFKLCSSKFSSLCATHRPVHLMKAYLP